jgi:hypothetical protein
LAQAFAQGHAQEIHARLAGTHIPMRVAATPVCFGDVQGPHSHVLLRVRASEPAAADAHPMGTPLARLVDTTAEGIVVTDAIGCVVVANRAFVQLVQAPGVEQVQGHGLATWLGHVGPSRLSGLPGLLQRVRQQGLVQMAAQTLHCQTGPALSVDLTVSLLNDGDQERFGFTLRACHQLASDDAPPLNAQTLALARALDALCADIGHTPLGPLLQRAEHLARGHLVQQALQRQTGAESTAATALGISEQELTRLRHEHACQAAPTGQ